MKKIGGILVVMMLGWHTVHAADARISLHCLSVRITTGAASSLGLSYTLDITSSRPESGVINHELHPIFGAEAPATHGSYYLINGDIFFEPVPGRLLLDVPESRDSDTNGMPDFYEVGHAFQATTQGIFEDIENSGNVTAVWTRAANSRLGTCRLTFDTYGLTFDHSFEIQEFRGVLPYQIEGTDAVASVTLTQADNESRTWSGRLVFQRNNIDQLALQSGALTNELEEALDYLESPEIFRFGSTYADFFIFRDGDLSTSVEDYDFWWLRIDDPNDTNGNGIPDFSDTPSQAVSPLLDLRRDGDKLLLSITGQIGQTYDLEHSEVIVPANWSVLDRITLTNNPQVTEIALPSGPSFWRLKSP